MSIYGWGLSRNGQAGEGDKNGKVIIPTKISVKGSHGNIIDLSAGGLYTAAITDANKLISFGCGKYGRLGNGSEDDQRSPSVHEIEGDALKVISCGLWHGCVLHIDGKVSIWGYQKACGGTTRGHCLVPQQVEGLSDCVGVSCGDNFTFAWTKDGHVYSWGANHNGVLGHGGSKEPVGKPLRIKALEDVKVVHMNAGFKHGGAVTHDGQVYMWGQGKHGALGLGERKVEDFGSPQLVPHIADIKEISCNAGENYGHSLALSNDGIVYATGSGYKGKLGLGDQNSHFMFQPISAEHFSNQIIEHVVAGGIHSSAIGVEGHVFTWGCGSDGRLGHPDAEGHRYLFRSDVPRMVEGLPGKARVLSSSYYHMVALVEK